MSSLSGTRLGLYEIGAPIGAGGMGEVYRAKDTRLNRDVAIKVLPESFALDADRVARFTREAQVLASVNHPNIAAIYGIEESLVQGPMSGVRALVMELVEGDDLSALIARRELTLADTLPIAKQIADALEAAHEQGIIHRDLKPQNIKVKPDGTVKVLDFGLARTFDGDRGASDPAKSPTLTARATQVGTIIGTAAYMAPEQARGRPVDKRADIWAFGVVLYEMLTGRQAFAGETITDIIAAVVTQEPDWSLVPAATPPAVREILERCLEKDPKRRLRDIGDARLAFETDTRRTSGSAALAAPLPPAPAPVARATSPRALVVMTVVSVALAIMFGVLWALGRSGGAGAAPNLQLSIAPPPGAEFQVGSNSGNVILSPDGTKVVFVASDPGRPVSLWVRSLNADDARPVSGTEGAFYPFWSPDSRHIGFFSQNRLLKVDLAGGLPEVLVETTQGRGGWWGEDDTILFTPTGGGVVHRVSAKGGTATPVTTLDLSRGENAHYWPVGLPGGDRFIFFVRALRTENAGIYLGRVDGSVPPVRLVPSLSSGTLATRPSDGTVFLLWARENELLAQEFDVAAGALRGEAVPIASDVRVEGSQRQVYASASRTGALVWATARAADAVFGVYSIDGRRVRQLPVPAADIGQPTLSPDGRRLAYLLVSKGQGDIYVMDVATGSTRRVSPTDDYDENAEWAPDGRTIYYATSQNGRRKLMAAPADGGAPVEIGVPDDYYGGAFESPERRYLIYNRTGTGTGLDVMALPLGGGSPIPLLARKDEGELAAGVSADRRWLAVIDDRGEIAIHRVIDDRGPLTLGPAIPAGRASAGSGSLVFSPTGGLFTMSGGGMLEMRAFSAKGDMASVGAPRPLFRPGASDGTFTLSNDGKEVIVTELPYSATQTFSVLTNWAQRLTR
jgi:hypothetical protein